MQNLKNIGFFGCFAFFAILLGFGFGFVFLGRQKLFLVVLVCGFYVCVWFLVFIPIKV